MTFKKYFKKLKEQIQEQTFSFVGVFLGAFSLLFGLYTFYYLPIKTMSVTGEILTTNIPVWIIGLAILIISLILIKRKKG